MFYIMTKVTITIVIKWMGVKLGGLKNFLITRTQVDTAPTSRSGTAPSLEVPRYLFASGLPAMVAVIGGQIAALVLPAGVLRPQVASGRLRLLATSGAQRSPYLPTVATLAEQGFAKLVVQEWFALFTHARVPPARVEAASQAVQVAIARPELVAAFAEWGMAAAPSTPAALAARIAAERLHWAPLIRAAGIRGD